MHLIECMLVGTHIGDYKMHFLTRRHSPSAELHCNIELVSYLIINGARRTILL
jgi:hypothetical protein